MSDNVINNRHVIRGCVADVRAAVRGASTAI